MNEFLRDRILRKIERLSDERAYQVLDYVEFLESKYAERPAPSANIFTDLLDGVEDKLRAGRVSASAVAETMGFLNKAMGVLNGVAAAGKSVATDIYEAATRPGAPRSAPADRGGATPPPSSPPPSSPPPTSGTATGEPTP